MPLEMDSDLKLDLSALEQDALLELWEIDLTMLSAKNGVNGDLYRLHSGLNEKGENVVWKGAEYRAYPIKGDNFQKSVSGTSNRPSLTVSNLFGFVTGLINDFDDCLGAVVTRRQVYASNLDPVNFKSGVNRQHNRNKEIVNVYVIEQVDSIKTEYVQFKLAIPTELDKLFLPARMMMATNCQHIYRSSECGYTGNRYFTEKDEPTMNKNEDKCSGCPKGCRLRDNIQNYGAYIAIDKL